MSQVALIGLPNVGKSTVFSALTKQISQIGTYPFSTTDLAVGLAEINDIRLSEASQIENSSKVTNVRLEIHDIPLNPNKPLFTPNLFGKLREMDGFVVIVRDFEGNNIDWGIVPNSVTEQIEKIDIELIIADIEILSNKESRLLKESKALSEKPKELETVKKALHLLNEGTKLSEYSWEDYERSFFKDLSPLTLKPKVLLINTEENRLHEKEFDYNSSEFVTTSAKIEHEISLLGELEQIEMREEYQMKESLLNKLLFHIYKELNLVSFFTIGDKESKAWTIPRDSKITSAAGRIHTDLERGFIKAEVVGIDDFISFGGWKGLKNTTKLRLEGKDYVVRDGDVVIIRFSR